jgi:iron complex outermembrane receptor protein
MKVFNSLFIVLIFISTSVYSQNIIRGKVTDAKDGEPLLGVNIILDELKLGTSTGLDGTFNFENIKSGNYTIKFSYIGHKTIVKEITVPLKEDLTVEMMEGTVNLNEIVVTGNPLATDPKNISQSTLTVANMDLEIKRGVTIAQMLNFQPGISMRSNGSATARPVIRGFSNNRILILENGLRMGDLSNTSDDHGVSSDGSSAERIEVLRGPASLLYGSNAIGGVINIITENIPGYVSDKLDGTISIGSSSVNNEFIGSGDIHYGINNFAFHGNYFNRSNGNYKDGNENKIANSDQTSHGYQFGVSFKPSFGIIGASYNNFIDTYGIPFNTNIESEEGPIKIEMKKNDFRFLSEGQNLGSIIPSFSLKGGFQNYEHKEILRNTGETGTAFGLKSFSSDLSFKHHPIFSRVNGVFGFWGMHQKYSVSGSEAFTPNADYTSFAAYIFEQMQLQQFNLQFGVRYEINKIEIPVSKISGTQFPSDQKNYKSLSGSLGFVYNLTDDISIYSNAAGAFRAPTIEELSSYAIHEATSTFDIGDRNLSSEKNLGLDFGFRVRKTNHIVEVSGYYNDINNYIFRKPVNNFYNPNAQDGPFNNDNTGIPVYKYNQNDAVIYGAEFKAQYEFTGELSTTVIFDYVSGKLKSNNENLPQLPPLRFSIEQRYATDIYWIGAQWKLAAAKNNTAQFEEPTKGYGIIDFYTGLKFLTGRFVHMFDLKISNLLDQPYKDHLSAIKDFAFMPGRNIQLSYKFLF